MIWTLVTSESHLILKNLFSDVRNISVMDLLSKELKFIHNDKIIPPSEVPEVAPSAWSASHSCAFLFIRWRQKAITSSALMYFFASTVDEIPPQKNGVTGTYYYYWSPKKAAKGVIAWRISALVLEEILLKWPWRLHGEGYSPGWKSWNQTGWKILKKSM